MNRKLVYEEPSAQLCSLRAQEELLNGIGVSETGGWGYDDDGPSDLRRANGE